MVTTQTEGRYLAVNPAHGVMTGFGMDQVIGHTVDEFNVWKGPEDRERIVERLQKEGVIHNADMVFCRSSGECFPALLSMVPVTLRGNRCLISIINDISDRKRAEDELRRTAENLRRSNQDLEQFAYVASHDLQEPLRMVTSYMDLLESTYKDRLDENARQFIAFAVDGAHRMRQLITDLLAFSRVTSRAREPGPVAMQAALDRAVLHLGAMIAETAAQITHDPLPEVLGDETQLTQVLLNLFSNAIKFRGKEPPRIHLGAKREPDRWVFSVSDNGIGIEPRSFDRIFQVFQRLHTRQEYPGSGIGLAICKRIVERYGGEIWVESQVGQGSTFFFTVPA